MKIRWRPFGSSGKKNRAAKSFKDGDGEKKIVNCDQHVQGAASLEEVFFDSQVWLDSDVEDFYSVNGDFTPSRDNTPVHPSNFIQTPERHNPADTNHDRAVEPYPTDKKMRLSEFFGEGFSEKSPTNNGQASPKTSSTATENVTPELRHLSSQKPTNGSPYASVISSSICSSNNQTPTKALKTTRYKSGCSSPCCLPSLGRSLSFRQKKKRLVPAQA